MTLSMRARNSAYAVNLTYDRHTDRPTYIYIYIYISREISIEHPIVGLASLAQLAVRYLISLILHVLRLYYPFLVTTVTNLGCYGLNKLGNGISGFKRFSVPQALGSCLASLGPPRCLRDTKSLKSLYSVV